jgi:hypothetical protein
MNNLAKQTWLKVCVLVGFSTCFVGNATADKRVALVIGNADYKSKPLGSPVNDARAMESSLRKAGFAVQLLTNASRREMNQAIGRFKTDLTGSDVGLFYFSGHGSQWEGRNYLIPIGANLSEAWLIEDETVTVRRVLGAMEAAGSPFNIVIFDACRSSPFKSFTKSGSQGLARQDAPKGTLLAFASAPDTYAADGGEGQFSLYTKHLLAAISKPDLSIEQVFKSVRIEVDRESGGVQVPWEESSLMGDFYFKGGPEQTVTSTQTTVQPDTSEELTLWETVKDSTDPDEFRAYLDEYPEGVYSGVARIRLEKLNTEAQSTTSAGSGLAPLSIHAIYASGGAYSGEWKDGLPDGQGTATFVDGRMYVGEWNKGRPTNIVEYNANGTVKGTYSNGKWTLE